MKKAISTNQAPQAIGPYSQGVETGKMLFVSGQIPINPETGEFVSDDIKEQTNQSLTNVKAILEAAGYTMEDVVKSTVLLNNINDFAAMNEVYGTFFEEPYPARAAFAAKDLPKNALVEIEVIAVKA